jgi:D-glycero-alpha-D-manno-heptose-7-phosphate kinase
MIIIQTPLRISLFGGGTDFPSYFLSEGGCVLSMAINKYIFVVIKERYDEKIRIGYTRTEIVDQVDQIEHELIREAFKKTGTRPGVEIITMGDIPAGSGLGSSSAVTVGALHAMYAYQNILVSKEQLAEEACDIEVRILKKPIGYQDQYISAFGGLRFIDFHQDGRIDCSRVNISPETLREINDHLMLFFTGVTRKAESILEEQKENIYNKLDKLCQLKEMASFVRGKLEAGRVDVIGETLHQSWMLKKQLANGISNHTIDGYYQIARQAGASGGKLTGAGGGGFLLLFCKKEKQNDVRRALHDLREVSFKLEPDGTKTLLNYRC